MNRLRRIHLYLGCLFAPLLVFFAATGACQMLGIPVVSLTLVHNQGLGSIPFRLLAAAMGISVVATSGLGVAMAFRMGGNRANVWACLAFGTLVPAAMLAIALLRRQ